MNETQLLESIRDQLIEINRQLNSQSRPTFAAEIIDNLAAMLERLEAIEAILKSQTDR